MKQERTLEQELALVEYLGVEAYTATIVYLVGSLPMDTKARSASFRAIRDTLEA